MTPMTGELKPGSFLVHPDGKFPRLGPTRPAIVPGWEIVSGIGAREVERELQSQGWHLFFVVDPRAHECGLGFDREAANRTALTRLVRRSESRRFNALEITKVSVRRLGPLWRARVEANFRHIGETPVLFEKRKHMTGSQPQRSMAAQAGGDA
jgi:hypothetical protein